MALLSDQDKAVAAAIHSLADVGEPAAIGEVLTKLATIPATSTRDQEDFDDAVNKAANGLVAELAGFRPSSVDEVRKWWLANRVTLKKPGAATGAFRMEEGNWNGQRYWTQPRFNVFYRIGSGSDAPASGPALGPRLEGAAKASLRAMEPVTGPMHLPPVRLWLCDPQQFQAKTSEGYFEGVAAQNEIFLKVAGMAKGLPSVMVHEYIHMVHNSAFPNQPRWLSEGVAMSFTAAPTKAGRTKMERTSAVNRILERGAFTDMTGWTSGGSGDELEGTRYLIAKLCVDYLRSADFGVSNERLAFLMGRIARKESAGLALKEGFGLGWMGGRRNRGPLRSRRARRRAESRSC